MLTLLQFIARISTFIYMLAAIGIFFAIRGVVQSQQALRIAVFGLEREAARDRLRRSFNAIILLGLLSGVVYVISNIVVPNMNGILEEPSPTPIVFVTQQPAPTEIRLLYPTITATIPVAPAAGAVQHATPDPNGNGCDVPGTMITDPKPNQSVFGQIAVQGQANIVEFSQYKFEINGPMTGGAWVVVGTFTIPVGDGLLGTWDSTSLTSGNYFLRLVVLRTDGSYPTPCQIPITISNTSGVPPSP